MVTPTDNVVPNQETTEISNDPLTTEEQESFVQQMMEKSGLSEADARAMLAMMMPQQVRTYLGLSSGQDEITREEAKAMWGLSDKEIDILFGGKETFSTVSNPFGDVFLEFLILSYSLGIDIKKLMAEVLQVQVDLGIEAAEERLKGAVTEFAMAMFAMVLTVGMGAAYAHSARVNGQNTPKGSPFGGQGNQFLGPFGITLWTQPINSAGQFGNQTFIYEGSIDDVHAEEMNKYYQQLQTLYQQILDAENDERHGL